MATEAATSRYPELWDRCILAYYPGYGSTGPYLFDFSGNVSDDTSIEAAQWVHGNDGEVELLTNATVGHVATPLSALSLTSLSVAFWVRVTTLNEAIWSWADPGQEGTPFLLLNHNGAGSVRFLVDNDYKHAFAVPNGTYMHIAITRSAIGEWLLYKDGVQIFAFTDDGTPTFQNFSSNIYWGYGFNGYASAQWNDMRVYDRALSSAEVELLALYAGIAYEDNLLEDWGAIVSGGTGAGFAGRRTHSRLLP